MRKIVVGYDGSDQARRALDRAAELVNGGTVTVVRASDPFMPPAPGSGGIEEAKARERHLDEARSALVEKGIKVETALDEGDAAQAIVGEATKAGADLIIVGTRGLNVARRAVLGSVSTKVVHHAPCDVLVVR